MNNYFLCLYQGVKSASCCGSVCIPALWAPWTTPNMDFNIQLLEMKACQMLSVTKLALPCLCLKPLDLKWKVLPPSLPFPGWESSTNTGELTPKTVSCYLCGMWSQRDLQPLLPLCSYLVSVMVQWKIFALKVQCGVMEIRSTLVHGTLGKKGKAGTSQKMQTLSSSRD